MIYTINMWYSPLNTGTATLYRTNSRYDFIRKAQQIIKERDVTVARLSRWHDRTTFSFPESTETSNEMERFWKRKQFVRKPEYIEYRKITTETKLKEVFEIE